MKKKAMIRKLLDEHPELTQEDIAAIVGCSQGLVSQTKNDSLDERKVWGMTDEDIETLNKLKHPENYKRIAVSRVDYRRY